VHNLAADPSQQELVAAMSARLETLISDEVGDDTSTSVLDRPNLVGWPSWRGDTAA
jgi:hypothetical protein